MRPKKTPLDAIHREFGARMVEFAGWMMPVQYRGALKEHLAVRSEVGVFDVSHMGELEFIGSEAAKFVQHVTCNDVSKMVEGQAQYSAFLTPEGTFIDDIVVYRLRADHFLICVNAARKDTDFGWVQSRQDGYDVQILDNSDLYVQLAIQGPAAERLLQQLTPADLSEIRFYRFTWNRVLGHSALISRTGYTGEDGFEIYIPPAAAEEVWRELFRKGEALGAEPAGLAARNTLRLEMRYPLYGNDIDDKHTPLEAGLGWIVKLDKGPFVGRDTLLQQEESGPATKLVGFELFDTGIVRDGFDVFHNGDRCGRVTSGGFSPSLQKSIGLTYLPVEIGQIGEGIEVEIRGKRKKAAVTKTPFYQRD